MIPNTSKYSLRLAKDELDMLAAQRLRYDVFVSELGGDGELVDHENRLEKDRFDPFYDHLILVDDRADPELLGHVIGVYRLLSCQGAVESGSFYSEGEYDLSVLKKSGRRLLELGRSCVKVDHRGGKAMFHLWGGLAEYVRRHEIEILFGVASFHGTDIDLLAEPLSQLHHRHLAPVDLRVHANEGDYQSMNLLAKDSINRTRAMREIPALIKAYLRLGGFVGDGAFVDHAFNTTDVCLVMDTARMNSRQRDMYTKEHLR